MTPQSKGGRKSLQVAFLSSKTKPNDLGRGYKQHAPGEAATTASLEWLNLNQEDVKWHKQRHLMPISRH
jgi:hypothetical protein